MIDLRLRGFGVLLLAAAWMFSGAPRAEAQSQARLRGDNVAPAYEGWEKNPDGSFNLVFGYFNRNLEEVVDLPIGVNNSMEPGGPDRGQPTRFLPRRNRFLFKVKVPADFGTKEVVWTLTANGKTEKAYASLKPDYFIDDQVVAMNFGRATGDNDLFTNNRPPKLEVGTKPLVARVGVPVTLTAHAVDDDMPKRRSLPPIDPLQPGGIAQASATGLRVAWLVYRGPGDVTFDPPQFKVYEDPRGGSPWSPGWLVPPLPPDSKWVVRATFAEPGTYILRCLAHDGALQTYEHVTVEVTK